MGELHKHRDCDVLCLSSYERCDNHSVFQHFRKLKTEPHVLQVTSDASLLEATRLHGYTFHGFEMTQCHSGGCSRIPAFHIRKESKRCDKYITMKGVRVGQETMNFICLCTNLALGMNRTTRCQHPLCHLHPSAVKMLWSSISAAESTKEVPRSFDFKMQLIEISVALTNSGLHMYLTCSAVYRFRILVQLCSVVRKTEPDVV